jgi:hypothetical protein
MSFANGFQILKAQNSALQKLPVQTSWQWRYRSDAEVDSEAELLVILS